MQVKELKNLLQLGSKTNGTSYPELENLIVGKEDTDEIHLLDTNNYLAIKLWSIGDVQTVLTDIINNVPENMKAIAPICVQQQNIIHCCVKDKFASMGDKTDKDWLNLRERINYVIGNTICDTPVLSGQIVDITNGEPKIICDAFAYTSTREVVYYGQHINWDLSHTYAFLDANKKRSRIYFASAVPNGPEDNSYWM